MLLETDRNVLISTKDAFYSENNHATSPYLPRDMTESPSLEVLKMQLYRCWIVSSRLHSPQKVGPGDLLRYRPDWAVA